MNTQNPYELSSLRHNDKALTHIPRSTTRWAFSGAVIAALFPVAFGMYALHRESVYAASLPPGTGACGMGTLAAMVIIVVGAPSFGIMGSIVGWLGSKFCP